MPAAVPLALHFHPGTVARASVHFRPAFPFSLLSCSLALPLSRFPLSALSLRIAIVIYHFGFVPDVYRTRRFEPADLERVMLLVTGAINEPYKPELFMSLGNMFPEGFLVVEDDMGRLAASMLAVPTPEYKLRIIVLAVDPAHRRRGVASHLLNMLRPICLRNGLRGITLEVRTDNLGARAFYERHGFVKTGVINNYYADGSDGYIYERMEVGTNPLNAPPPGTM